MGFFGDAFKAFSSMGVVGNPQDIINAQMTGTAISKYISETSRLPTGEWLGYNKVKLHDFPDNCRIRFVVKCDHDPQAESIPVSCRESFMDLAVLDVEMTLYNNLKNMNNIGSAFKEIQLKIDDWSGAEGNRNNLIKEWTENFHLDQTDLISFF